MPLFGVTLRAVRAGARRGGPRAFAPGGRRRQPRSTWTLLAELIALASPAETSGGWPAAARRAWPATPACALTEGWRWSAAGDAGPAHAAPVAPWRRCSFSARPQPQQVRQLVGNATNRASPVNSPQWLALARCSPRTPTASTAPPSPRPRPQVSPVTSSVKVFSVVTTVCRPGTRSGPQAGHAGQGRGGKLRMTARTARGYRPPTGASGVSAHSRCCSSSATDLRNTSDARRRSRVGSRRRGLGGRRRGRATAIARRAG